MSLKANPRSRGKRPTSNRLAVERIIRDAETMVNRDHADPEAVRAFLLANVTELAPLAPGRDMRAALTNGEAFMFQRHLVTYSGPPEARVRHIRTDDMDGSMPLPRWRFLALLGTVGAESLTAAKNARTREVASTGPSVVLSHDGPHAFELSAARLHALVASLPTCEHVTFACSSETHPDTLNALDCVTVERSRLLAAFKALRPMGPIVATIEPSPGMPLAPVYWAGKYHPKHGPIREGEPLLVLSWGVVGRMRFKSVCLGLHSANGPIVPLVDASEWAEVNDQEVTFADAAE